MAMFARNKQAKTSAGMDSNGTLPLTHDACITSAVPLPLTKALPVHHMVPLATWCFDSILGIVTTICKEMVVADGADVSTAGQHHWRMKHFGKETFKLKQLIF
mmetsp:Transcript_115579/g.327540  ORF Transcript_115579/g.327540 Transcript_115579/m.327540 type:complete len:103 (+) Transcript_115579:95-403(+)